ncbi:MAG: hypothetical protein H7Y39_15485 [Nitrospiraceae bacterium]|nr:hypothetical protein [Nitrospiraceae bacterium]
MIETKAQSGKLQMAIFYTAVLDRADLRDAELYRAVLIGS